MPTILNTKPADGQTAANGKKAAHVRVPNKTTINFAEVGVKRVNWLVAVPAFVLILAAALAFSKFLVLDRLAAVAEAESEAAQVQHEVNQGYARIASYGELNDLYAHYTYSGMTEEETGRVDRVAVMDLLERVVFPRTSVEQWSLKSNELTLNIDGSTLQEINDTVQRLLAEDLVYFCTVNTAATDTSRTVEAAQNGDKVTANIVVYLTNPEEVAS